MTYIDHLIESKSVVQKMVSQCLTIKILTHHLKRNYKNTKTNK